MIGVALETSKLRELSNRCARITAEIHHRASGFICPLPHPSEPAVKAMPSNVDKSATLPGRTEDALSI